MAGWSSRRVRLAVVVVVLGALVQAPLAAAQTSLECSATVGDQSTGTGTITVRKDDNVTITGRADPYSTTQIFLNFFSFRRQVGEAVAGADGVWTGTIKVKEYAKWGVGLYRVDWRTAGLEAARRTTCTADVKVEGSFFNSRVSWLAMATLAVSAGGLLLTLRTAISAGRGKNPRWELKATAKAKVARDEETGKWRVKMLGYSIAQTCLSTAWGLIASGGTIATLVGTATSPPTISLAATVAIPFALVGFFAGQLKVQALRLAARRAAGARHAASAA